VGEQHVLTLKGFGSAGYVWEPVIEGDAAAIDVRIGPATTPATPDEATPPMAFSVDQEVAITARALGHVTVHFRLVRPWAAEVREETLVRVRVVADQTRHDPDGRFG
jgi:hypothetical protein